MSRLLADGRAFMAAIRREWRQVRRYPMLFIALLYWPILLPGIYVLMGRVYSGTDPRAIAAFVERSGVSDIAGFIFVGQAMWLWLSFLLWGPGTALRQEQLRGSLEAVFLTPASRLVVLFGPPLAHVAYTLMSFVIGAVGMRALFGVVLPFDAVMLALLVIAVAIPAMHAIAALFAAAVLRYGEVNSAVHLVRGVLVLAAGVTFPVIMLPDWAQAGAAVLPPTYVVSATRRVLLAGADLGAVAADLAIVLGLTALFGGVALVVYRWTERQARVTGMLGRY